VRFHDTLGTPNYDADWDGDELVLPSGPPRAREAGRLPPAGPLRLGAVELGPGQPIVVRRGEEAAPSTVWATDDVVSEPVAAWNELAHQFPATGLWPLLLHGLYDGSGRPWDSGELEPVTEADVDALDVREVLAAGWRGWVVPIRNPWPLGTGPLAPFGDEFPGLAPPQPTSRTLPIASPGGFARMGLVSCRRPADPVALAGWLGTINVTGPTQVSAVLRSWEDRFGAILVGLGFATITLLVTRPPVTDDDALLLAAEVAALCPDALWQPEALPLSRLRDPSLESMSRLLVREPLWQLWFD
jgi:hypothetical protein